MQRDKYNDSSATENSKESRNWQISRWTTTYHKETLLATTWITWILLGLMHAGLQT